MRTDGKITTIYNNYHNDLKKYLFRKVKTREDVDDVAQEVYLRLIRHKNFDDLKPTLTFLCNIATNIIIDRFRRNTVRKKDAHVTIENSNIESKQASPEQKLKTKEIFNKFKAEFKTLNKDTRKAFVLHRFRGLTYDEIALKMGISKSMVYKHLSKVMLHMSQTFGNEK